MNLDKSNILTWEEDLIKQKLDDVLTIIQKRIEVEDDQAILYIKLALEVCVKCIPINDLEKRMFKYVCPVVDSLYRSTLKGISCVDDLSLLSQTPINAVESLAHILGIRGELSTILTNCANAIQLNSCIELSDIKSFMCCSLQIIEMAMLHEKQALSIYGHVFASIQDQLKLLLVKTYNLNLAVLQILKLASVDVKFTLEELFDQLGQVAEITLDLDAKVMVETWKCLIHIVENCKDKIDNNSTIINLVKKLCLKVHSNLLSFIENNSLTIMNIKILGFLLKIIIKLINNFKGKLDACCYETVVDLLIILCRSTPSHLSAIKISTEIIGELNRQLVIGADPLLSTVLDDQVFGEVLVRKLGCDNIDDPYGCLILATMVMSKISNSSTRHVYSSISATILDLTFPLLSFCNDGIQMNMYDAPGTTTIGLIAIEKDLYHFVFLKSSVYILSSSALEFPRIEEILLKYILQENPWCAMLASDLYCLIARFAEPEVCHTTVNVLLKCLEQFNLRSDRPQFVYVISLVRRLLDLCDTNFAYDLMNICPLQRKTTLLTVMQPQTDQQKTLIVNKLNEILDTNCYEENNSFLDNAIYYLKFLTTVDLKPTCDISTLLDKLWSYTPDSTNHSSLTKYFIAACYFSAGQYKNFDQEVALKILRRVKELSIYFTSTSSQLAVLRLISTNQTMLEGFHKNEIMDEVCNLYNILLHSSNVIVRELGLNMFSSYALTTSHPQVVAGVVSTNDKLKEDLTNYLQKKLLSDIDYTTDSHLKFKHDCVPILTNEGSIPCHKRPKLGDDNVVVVEEALSSLITAASGVIKLSNYFSSEHLEQIKNIVEQLGKLTRK